MHKHTPGPWVTHLGDERARCDCETILTEHACVATILYDRGDEHDWQYPDKETAKANARLIAAAPDLLEALERCAGALRTVSPGGDGDPDVEAAMAAIEKTRE